jgi:predicted RNA-binding Zn ribbon-like protein
MAHDPGATPPLASGFAFTDLVRMSEAGRLRRCEAPDCDAVLVDLSKNRSRRYCDTGNRGNRQHVAAYRERLYRDRLADRETRPEVDREARPEVDREARPEAGRGG